MGKINKVAEITFLFWVMKIIATTLGETLGDFFSMTLNLGYSKTLIASALFFVGIVMVQIFQKKYIPTIYWLVIIATTTMGTEISDFIDRSLHLGYTGGSLILSAGLFLTLFIWNRKFKDLSVSPIVDSNKELLYWIAILFSNSLGTAFGDFLSDVVGLEYLSGAMATSGVIIIVALLHKYTKINDVFLFWGAFIFTRPFGATFGDFLTKPVSSGGMNLGTFNASLVSMILITTLIVVSHKKMEYVKVSDTNQEG